jgi:hypothetical protein
LNRCDNGCGNNDCQSDPNAKGAPDAEGIVEEVAELVATLSESLLKSFHARIVSGAQTGNP